MQTLPASVRASLIGIVAACVTVTLFATLSGFALSEGRLAEVVRTAFAKDELVYAARTSEDFFTECALLEMQHLRRGGVFRSALDTRFLMRPGEHSCDALRTLMLGTAEERASLPPAVSYFNYPFGSRHLEAFVLSVLDYGPASRLYRVLSYGSVALLFLVMLWQAPAKAIVLAPIPLFLIGAFAFHHFGGNLAHAPGYFIGFAALAFFVGAPRVFESFERRLGFAGALGVLAAYFDLLNGVIVTLLALTILLNHFFYVFSERDPAGYARKGASQGVAIFLCFLMAYVSVTLGRLGLLSLYGVDVSAFTANLSARAAHDIGIPITFRLNLETLYALRSRLTSGGASAANWVLLAGIAGWIFAGITGLAAFAFRRSLRTSFLTDVLVLAMVSVGVFVWYRCFTAHTYIHAPFMVRLLALPLACGLVAAILAAHEGTRDRATIALLPIAFCAALYLSARMLHDRWMIGTAIEARFVDARADLVSCGQLGLRPDGQPDGIIEIRFETIRPPLAYLGLGRDTYIQLVRRDPLSGYHTGPIHNVLGIATEPGGSLLNRQQGGFRFTAATNPNIFGHFCREGDRPSSRYALLVDGVTIPIAPD